MDKATNVVPNHMPLIRASELAQYGFCHRAWWLSTIKGLAAANQAARDRGTQLHQRHTGKVRAALDWRRAGFLLLGSGSFLLIIVILWLWLF